MGKLSSNSTTKTICFIILAFVQYVAFSEASKSCPPQCETMDGTVDEECVAPNPAAVRYDTESCSSCRISPLTSTQRRQIQRAKARYDYQQYAFFTVYQPLTTGKIEKEYSAHATAMKFIG